MVTELICYALYQGWRSRAAHTEVLRPFGALGSPGRLAGSVGTLRIIQCPYMHALTTPVEDR